jgi:hypothetical protein
MRISKILRRMGVAQEGSETSSVEASRAEREQNFSFRLRATEEDLRPCGRLKPWAEGSQRMSQQETRDLVSLLRLEGPRQTVQGDPFSMGRM